MVVCVIAVADERVSTASSLTTQYDRTTGSKFIINQVYPTSIAVVLTIGMAHTTIVAKVGFQCKGNGLVVCRRTTIAIQTIHHLNRRATILHQLGYSILLFVSTNDSSLTRFWINGNISLTHLVPFKGSGREFGNIQRNFLPVFVLSVGRIGWYQRARLSRILVVIHQLGKTRSHAARDGTHVTNHRTPVVVWTPLIPPGLNKRFNGSTAAPMNGGASICRDISHLLLIALQQIAQTIGHVILMDAATICITQDGGGAIITTNNHKTISFAKVKQIVANATGRSTSTTTFLHQFYTLGTSLFTSLLQECLHLLTCLCLTHRSSTQ